MMASWIRRLRLRPSEGRVGPRVVLTLTLPHPDLLASALEAGDTLVDLTSTQLLEVPDTVDLIRTGVMEQQNFEAGKRRFLDWLDELPEQATEEGGALFDTLQYDERLNLWWFFGLTSKHFSFHDFPRLALAVSWLKQALAEDHPIVGLIRRAAVVEVWTSRQRTARYLMRWLQASLHLDDARIRGRFAVDRARGLPATIARARNRYRLIEKTLRLSRDLLHTARHIRRIANLPEPVTSISPKTLVVPTWPDSWRPSPTGEQENRYLGDLGDRLRDRGIELALLPAVPGGKALTHFHSRMSGSAVPLRWELTREQLRTLPKICSRLLGIRRDARPRILELGRQGLLRYEGIDITEWLLEELDDVTLDVGFQLTYLYENLRHSFEVHRPGLLLYKDEFYTTGRAVSAAASGQAICVGFQHGAIPKTHFTYIVPASATGSTSDLGSAPCRAMPTPDVFLAYGESVREHVCQRGYPKQRVLPIGSLRHDALFERARGAGDNEGDELRSRLGIGAETRLLLLCTAAPGEVREWVRITLAATNAAARPTHVIIKPHPRFPAAAEIAGGAEASGASNYTVISDDLERLILGADVVVTGSSTTGVEALILGTPLLAFHRPGQLDPMGYLSEQVALAVYDVSTMMEALDRLEVPEFLESWWQRRDLFLRRHASPSLGKSTVSFEELLQRLLTDGISFLERASPTESG